MDAQDYLEARPAIRAKLAQRLRWDEVPDGVWARLEGLKLVYEVAWHRDKASWRELLEAARTERAELPDSSPGSGAPPGRGTERDAPREIVFEPSEDTRRRGEVYSGLVAAKAERRADVRNFRRTFLEGFGLTAQAADSYFGGGESGRNRLDRSDRARRKLDRIARSLSRFYGWTERQAARYVLTSEEPVYRPVRVAVASTDSTARVTITADVWADVEEVTNAYRAARRQILGSDKQKIPELSLELVRFVKGQTGKDGTRPSWPEMLERWNRRYPTWRFATYRAIRQHHERAHDRLMRPGYNRPQWKRRDPS